MKQQSGKWGVTELTDRLKIKSKFIDLIGEGLRLEATKNIPRR